LGIDCLGLSPEFALFYSRKGGGAAGEREEKEKKRKGVSIAGSLLFFLSFNRMALAMDKRKRGRKGGRKGGKEEKKENENMQL